VISKQGHRSEQFARCNEAYDGLPAIVSCLNDPNIPLNQDIGTLGSSSLFKYQFLFGDMINAAAGTDRVDASALKATKQLCSRQERQVMAHSGSSPFIPDHFLIQHRSVELSPAGGSLRRVSCLPPSLSK
jgi:hypothetical protein